MFTIRHLSNEVQVKSSRMIRAGRPQKTHRQPKPVFVTCIQKIKQAAFQNIHTPLTVTKKEGGGGDLELQRVQLPVSD